MKSIAGLLFLLASSALRAQSPASLVERARTCPLPEEARAQLVESLAARNYARAESILDAAKSPANAELGALAGAIAFLDGHMDRAAQAFRTADALAPLDDRDRFTWAMALLNLADAEGARSQLSRLHTAHPNTPLYLYWLARIDYDQRLYEQAVSKLRHVIQLEPSSARAYDNLGLALDMMGKPAEALAAFRTAVELNRKLPQPSPWPPHNLGALLLRQQDLPEAESALREALRYDPQFSTAHYHLARVLDAAGRDEAAIPEYRAAATLQPVVVEALYSLGLIYRRQGKTAEAAAAFAEYKKLKAKEAK